MLGQSAVEIIRRADVETAGGFALQDVQETHFRKVVGPWGLEPQTFPARRDALTTGATVDQLLNRSM